MTSPDPTPFIETLVVIPTELGPIRALYHPVVAPEGTPRRGAVLAVGGFDGGFDGPANGLYADLGAALPARGIAVLRLDFRVKTSPGPIDDGAFDVLRGVDWLVQQGCAPVALVGHSYGGAVVVRAGVRSGAVAGVATLATQTMGIEEIARLAPRRLLMIHGLADDRLPPRGTEWAFARAGEPKALHLLENATHSLRQRRDDVWALLRAWLDATLPPPR